MKAMKRVSMVAEALQANVASGWNRGGSAELFADRGVERTEGEEGERSAEEEQVLRGHGQTVPRVWRPG